MHHPLVHMFLVVQLALWSPVMCCCAIKGAIRSVAGTVDNSRQVESCCAKQIVDAPPSCCGGADEAGASDQRRDGKDGNCRCHERIASKVQLDTGAKIHIPAPHFAVAHVDLSFDLTLLTSQCSTLSVDNLRAHPPPLTLLAQRCLLLI